jgi:hypothetical protein
MSEGASLPTPAFSSTSVRSYVNRTASCSTAVIQKFVTGGSAACRDTWNSGAGSSTNTNWTVPGKTSFRETQVVSQGNGKQVRPSSLKSAKTLPDRLAGARAVREAVPLLDRKLPSPL